MLFQKNVFLRLKQWTKINIKITYHTKSKTKGNDHLIFTSGCFFFSKKSSSSTFTEKKIDLKDAKKK